MENAVQLSPIPEQDEDGLLRDPEQWTEALAQQLADQLGIGKLSQDHWLIIFALRDYFKKFGVAPAMSNICHSQHKDVLWVHNLFSSCLNAWRVAGLPNPGEEAKSYLSDM